MGISITGGVKLPQGKFKVYVASAGPAGKTMWAWGAGSNGKLGLGDTANKSSPVQIGALSDWASVETGDSHSLAVKTDGTLWAWGLATSGRLGDGTVISKSSPVQVGALTIWDSVSAGFSHSTALQ